MRTYTHIIDTKAVKKTMNCIPDYWVVRELTERDYGIDLMVEIFSEGGTDKKGKVFYDTTGYVCYLQIKGIDSKLRKGRDGIISFNVKKETLLYVEKFATPFFLIRASTIDPNVNEIYFLWLQRYITEILDYEIPTWREGKQKNFSLKIPVKNKLPENSEKIETIASRIKFIEEQLEFRERYDFIKMAYSYMISGTFTQYSELKKDLNRIKKLQTLLSRNNCCIDRQCIEDVENYVASVENGTSKPTEMDDFPHEFNLSLLSNESEWKMIMETFLAENQNDTVY